MYLRYPESYTTTLSLRFTSVTATAAAIPSFYLLVLADFPNPIYGFWKFIPIATYEQNTKAAPQSATSLQSSQAMQVCMCVYYTRTAAVTRLAPYVIFNSLTN